MFSIKKYAIVGVAALTAFTISCSDEEKSESKYVYDKTGSVTLYGAGSNAGGSSLDIDGSSFKVCTVTQLNNGTCAKSDIDVVFDGQNAYTPSAIGNADVPTLSALYSGVDTEVIFFEVKGESAEDLVDAVNDSKTDFFDKTPLSDGKKFGVITTDVNLALVKVTTLATGEQKVTISVSRTTGEEE